MTTSSPTRKLERLAKAHADAQGRQREIEATPRALRAEVERLGRELTEQHDLPVDGSPPPAGTPARKAWDQWTEAKSRLEGPWAARVERARERTREAERALADFIAENIGALLAEREPEALAARDAVTTTLDAFVEAVDRWQGLAQGASALLRPVPGVDGSDVPSLPLDGVRRELRALRGVEIPPPLPASFFATDEEADDDAQAHARAVEAAVTAEE